MEEICVNSTTYDPATCYNNNLGNGVNILETFMKLDFAPVNQHTLPLTDFLVLCISYMYRFGSIDLLIRPLGCIDCRFCTVQLNKF